MPISLPGHMSSQPLQSGETASRIILHFNHATLPSLDDELSWFESKHSFLWTIKRAAIARGLNGKRLSHQRRIPRQVLLKVLAKLKSLEITLQACKTFDDLYAEINHAIGGFNGVGPLYLYDTALRIGAYHNLKPNDVYLHAGTMKGAKKLLKNKYFTPISPLKPRFLPPNKFPHPYSMLPAYQLENLLCCYRRWL